MRMSIPSPVYAGKTVGQRGDGVQQVQSYSIDLEAAVHAEKGTICWIGKKIPDKPSKGPKNNFFVTKGN